MSVSRIRGSQIADGTITSAKVDSSVLTSADAADFDVAGAAAAAQAASQPLDADLTAIAALSTAAFGRDLLTQVDAAAVRSYIGAIATADVAAALDAFGGLTGSF